MRLLKVELSGFKRFAERARFTVDSDVVALVGPNEAGKSSVLKALAELNDDGPIAKGDLSRGANLSDEAEVVRVVFQLDDEDRAALAGISEAAGVQRVTVAKRVDGELAIHFHPEVARDLAPRAKAIELLRRAAASPTLREARWDEDGDPIAGELRTLAASLEEAEEELAVGLIDDLRSLAAGLRESVGEGPKYVVSLPETLEALAEDEDTENPGVLAANAIEGLLPRFEWFDDDARSLASEYEITSLRVNALPVALDNLAALAGLDLARLQEAVEEDRRGEIRGLQEQANERLAAAFAGAWTQGGLSVSLSVEDSVLRLYVREEEGSFWELAERSDGLRWFVALVALLHRRKHDAPPILLIDEAEQHLHYDAQADLIRTFAQQSEAATIVYTTHSAGCLPQDLGAGVKVVKRTDPARSTIRNGFWVDDSGTPDEAGFSSVLMEMGASTLAFSAARFALICEGRTELILLPALLREVTGWEIMPFQVVPGLASINPYAVPHLDLAASKVLFMVDRDAAGKAIEKKLRGARVPPDRLHRLGTAPSTTLEDFIDAEVHQRVLNQELEGRGERLRVPAGLLRTFGRAGRLAKHYKKHGVKEPNKAQIAHALLSEGRLGVPLVDARRAEALRELGETLLGQFERRA